MIADKSAEVIREAKTWLGTPFHHHAMVKGAGVDCAHFLIGVYSAVGLIDPMDVEGYPPDWHLHRGEERFLDHIKRHADKVAVPEPGDVAMFRFGRCASHGAIVIEWPRIIHAYIRQGVVIATAHDPELRGRVDSFWALREG